MGSPGKLSLVAQPALATTFRTCENALTPTQCSASLPLPGAITELLTPKCEVYASLFLLFLPALALIQMSPFTPSYHPVAVLSVVGAKGMIMQRLKRIA